MNFSSSLSNVNGKDCQIFEESLQRERVSSTLKRKYEIKMDTMQSRRKLLNQPLKHKIISFVGGRKEKITKKVPDKNKKLFKITIMIEERKTSNTRIER